MDFLPAAAALLVVSLGLALIPGLCWRGGEIGVPTKDRIFQSMEFLVCAFALLGYACEAGRAQRRRWALSLGALALLFLANIFFVVTGRTALLVAPVLLLWLGWREFRWKGLVGRGCGRLHRERHDLVRVALSARQAHDVR